MPRREVVRLPPLQTETPSRVRPTPGGITVDLTLETRRGSDEIDLRFQTILLGLLSRRVY